MTDPKIVVEGNNINVGGTMPVLDGVNLFGGLNPAGLYVPMTDLEQEAFSRLRETQDLKLVIVGWGEIENPKMIIGDHRIRIDFRLIFRGLLIARPLHFLDLELRTGADEILFRERHSVIYNNQPLNIFEGMELEMMWDIAVKQMSPELVKRLTGAVGLTSRRQDRDTHEFTPEGNMRLSPEQKQAILDLEGAEARVKAMDKAALANATKKAAQR